MVLKGFIVALKFIYGCTDDINQMSQKKVRLSKCTVINWNSYM